MLRSCFPFLNCLLVFSSWVSALASPNAVVVAQSSPNPWDRGSIEPVWAHSVPTRTLQLKYDNTIAEDQNGRALLRAVAALQAGDRLEISPGRYMVASKFSINLRGTAEHPIWIVAADPEQPPVITRPDARQNVLNVGDRSTTDFVCFRNLELTGGSTLIRFYDCHQLWLDQCELHHGGGEGITTNTHDTSHLFITNNHFHHFTNPKATGEAMYLGANHGKYVMSYSVIANNHVHHCAGSQGDGIEIKQGSHHNWVVGNHVHDTQYPCILVYGTNGKGINVVERNTCYRSGDNVLQAQGEALIRNNLLMSGQGAALASTDHQGKSRHLTVVHNTLITPKRGASLTSWNNRDEMVFANNVVYTDGGQAIHAPNGIGGVTMAGNVLLGQTPSKSIQGRGLDDFQRVTWDANHRNVQFRAGSELIGRATPEFAVRVDIEGRSRTTPPTAGAFRAPE